MTLFDLLSFQAFSSFWYWVCLALVWTRVTVAPFGIPADLYDRARGLGPDGDADAFGLIRVSVARQLAMGARFGPWLVAAWAFLLSLLAGTALYGSELALALLCLAAPMALVHGLVQRSARQMANMTPELEGLFKCFNRLRLKVQVVSVLALFVTAVIGMIHNLNHLIF